MTERKRPRTYTVHDGDGATHEEPVPSLTARIGNKSLVAILTTTALSGVIGIATSRWGGVSQDTFDTATKAIEQKAVERQAALIKAQSDAEAKWDAFMKEQRTRWFLEDQEKQKKRPKH